MAWSLDRSVTVAVVVFCRVVVGDSGMVAQVFCFLGPMAGLGGDSFVFPSNFQPFCHQQILSMAVPS